MVEPSLATPTISSPFTVQKLILLSQGYYVLGRVIHRLGHLVTVQPMEILAGAICFKECLGRLVSIELATIQISGPDPRVLWDRL